MNDDAFDFTWNYKTNSIEYQLLSGSEIIELFRPNLVRENA